VMHAAAMTSRAACCRATPVSAARLNTSARPMVRPPHGCHLHRTPPTNCIAQRSRVAVGGQAASDHSSVQCTRAGELSHIAAMQRAMRTASAWGPNHLIRSDEPSAAVPLPPFQLPGADAGRAVCSRSTRHHLACVTPPDAPSFPTSDTAIHWSGPADQ
jgi:hypothetical protein